MQNISPSSKKGKVLNNVRNFYSIWMRFKDEETASGIKVGSLFEPCLKSFQKFCKKIDASLIQKFDKMLTKGYLYMSQNELLTTFVSQARGRAASCLNQRPRLELGSGGLELEPSSSLDRWFRQTAALPRPWGTKSSYQIGLWLDAPQSRVSWRKHGRCPLG